MISRIEQMKLYLAEAELDPENNKLYIEDLKLAISSGLYGKEKADMIVGTGFKTNEQRIQTGQD